MFDQLTSATPKRVEKKVDEESEEEEEIVEEGSDEEVEPKKPYFTEDQPYRCTFILPINNNHAPEMIREATEKLKGLREGGSKAGGRGRGPRG